MRLNSKQRTNAVKHLINTDQCLADHILRIGACELKPSAYPFDVLARSIIGQQLSAKAAGAIVRRLESTIGQKRPFAPQLFLDVSDELILEAGMSRSKVACVKSLASVAANDPTFFQRLHKLDDEGVIAELTQFRGIGRWTSEMFLIFGLGRPDVLSMADAGLRRGMQILRNLDKRPADDDFVAYAARWRPYRSIASWYLWAIVDNL